MKYLVFLTVIIISILSSCDSIIPIDEEGSETHMVSNGKIDIETVIQYPGVGTEPSGFVVFARGSGDGDMRSYTPGVHENFLLDVFLHRGIAVVYQNKRGIGRSTGNWKMNSMEGRAEDLLAVVDYYRNLPGFNAEIDGLSGIAKADGSSRKREAETRN